MARSAGTLGVALTANSTAFERAMARAQGQLRSFGKTVKSTAMTLGVAFGASQLIGGFKSLTAEMDGIDKRSGVLNISAERYQQFAYAARRTGTEIGTVESAMKRMDMTLAKAVSGEKSAIDAFRALGLEVSDIRKLKPDELFDLVAKSIGEIGDPAEKSAAQIALFGKNGAELNNFLRDYIRYGEEAKKNGLLFSKEDVEAAKNLTDAMTDLGTAVKVLVANSGLTKWLNGVAEGILAVKNSAEAATAFVAELARRAMRLTIDYGTPMGVANTIAAKIRGEETLGEQAANAAIPEKAIQVAAATAAEVAEANTKRQMDLIDRADREAKRAAYLAERAAGADKEKAVKAEKVKEAPSSAAGDFSIAALARSLVGNNAPMERTADATEQLLAESKEQTQMQRQALQNNENSPQLTYS